MEHTGHIGRRNHYAVWLSFIGSTPEKLVLHPVTVPFVLDGSRIVFRRDVHSIRFRAKIVKK
jgi:hypothetical protein